MKCGYHPEREAVGVCVGCGRGICEFCKTILNDKLNCPTCAEKSIMEPEKSQKPIISEQATKDGAKSQPQSTGISSNSVDKPAKKEPSKAAKIIVGIIFIVIIVVGISTCMGGSSNVETKTLGALITFDGAQFTITNGDNYDWHNVKMQLNPGVMLSGGYDYEASTVMLAGQTYTVGCMQFAAGTTRFNPYTTVAEELCIYVDNDNDGSSECNGCWNLE